MPTYGLWIGLGTCFVSSLLGYWAQQQEIEALRGEVTALTEALAIQRRAQTPPLIDRGFTRPAAQAAPADQTVPAAPAAQTVPAVPAAPADQVVPHPPSAEEVAAEVQNGFLREATDPTWAPSAQRSLRDGVAALGLDGRSVRSIECRKHSCRMETVHISTDEGQRFVSQALRPSDRPLWEGGMYVEPAEELSDGRVTITTYFLGAAKD